MPSYHESFGLTILEALNYDMTVVSYDLEIYKKLFFNHINKVKVGDKKAFAKKYLKLKDHNTHKSEKLRTFLLNHEIQNVSLNEFNLFTK